MQSHVGSNNSILSTIIRGPALPEEVPRDFPDIAKPEDPTVKIPEKLGKGKTGAKILGVCPLHSHHARSEILRLLKLVLTPNLSKLRGENYFLGASMQKTTARTKNVENLR